ncbi:hypothetical protein EVA_15279 [gut metagenome]|uniref:Uncharacterized protein n=1 Tax=gut metagenome TaxID=749906 RepID=J9FQ65_9ZZZZ
MALFFQRHHHSLFLLGRYTAKDTALFHCLFQLLLCLKGGGIYIFVCYFFNPAFFAMEATVTGSSPEITFKSTPWLSKKLKSFRSLLTDHVGQHEKRHRFKALWAFCSLVFTFAVCQDQNTKALFRVSCTVVFFSSSSPSGNRN